MTTRFNANGVRVPVTVLSIETNTVLAHRTKETDGYTALQIGTGARKQTNKPMQGHLKKSGVEKAPRVIKEVRVTEEFLHDDYAPGKQIVIFDVVKPGSLVNVQGTSKGKGFQGGMKRWGFHGGPATHGQSDRSRAPGSIGSGTTPGRVYKGKKMAGHMGVDTITTKNLEVFDMNVKTGEIELMGPVPGPRNGYITVNVVGEVKNYVGPAKIEEPETVVEEMTPQEEQTMMGEEEAETQTESTDTVAEATANEVSGDTDSTTASDNDETVNTGDDAKEETK